MTNGQIFDLVNVIIRKEKEGDTISPADFSDLLYMCSEEKANSDYSYYEQSQVITDSLRSLSASTAVSLTVGVGDFITAITNASKTYWHATGVVTSTREVQLLTSLQYNDYKYSDLLAPTADFPVCKIFGDGIYVLPTSITTVNFEYFQKPNVPFYDYYIDANDNYQYIEPGTVYTLLSGEEYEDKEDGTIFNTPGDTIGVKPTNDANNMSVALSFPRNERIQIIYMILEKIGIALNEQDAVQYGLAKEQKEEDQ